MLRRKNCRSKCNLSPIRALIYITSCLQWIGGKFLNHTRNNHKCLMFSAAKMFYKSDQAAWLWLLLDPGMLSGFARGSNSANSLNQAALSSFLGTGICLRRFCSTGALLLTVLSADVVPSRRFVVHRSWNNNFQRV